MMLKKMMKVCFLFGRRGAPSFLPSFPFPQPSFTRSECALFTPGVFTLPSSGSQPRRGGRNLPCLLTCAVPGNEALFLSPLPRLGGVSDRSLGVRLPSSPFLSDSTAGAEAVAGWLSNRWLEVLPCWTIFSWTSPALLPGLDGAEVPGSRAAVLLLLSLSVGPAHYNPPGCGEGGASLGGFGGAG